MNKCATVAGWNIHQRNQETPCAACRKAKAEQVRQWRYRTGRTKQMLVPVTRQ